jgi:hypothetical protein
VAAGWGHRPHIPFGESIRQWLQHARQSDSGRESVIVPSQVAKFRPRPLAPDPDPAPVDLAVPPDLSVGAMARALGQRGTLAMWTSALPPRGGD